MKSNTLRLHGIVILVLLLGEFIFGMLTNLYVHFPDGNSSAQQWEYAGSQALAVSHMAIGVLLVLSAVSLLVVAIKAKDRTWKLASGLGLVSILAASMFGTEFVSKQTESSSFWMALLFLVAVAVYGWGIYQTRTVSKI